MYMYITWHWPITGQSLANHHTNTLAYAHFNVTQYQISILKLCNHTINDPYCDVYMYMLYLRLQEDYTIQYYQQCVNTVV